MEGIDFFRLRDNGPKLETRGAISVGYAKKRQAFNEILAFFEILNVD